jgi:hypothetical protein
MAETLKMQFRLHGPGKVTKIIQRIIANLADGLTTNVHLSPTFMKTLVTICVILLFTTAISCKHAALVQYDCTGITPGYASDIKPILDTHCATSGCHSGDKPAAGIGLADYTDASKASTNKNFMGAIQQLSGYIKMPKKADKLSDSQIRLLYCWAESGSPQ